MILNFRQHVSVEISAVVQQKYSGGKLYLFEMARAGVWYTDNITVKNAVIEAPKNFHPGVMVCAAEGGFANAAETLWNCEGCDGTGYRERGLFCDEQPEIWSFMILRWLEIIPLTGEKRDPQRKNAVQGRFLEQ